MSFVAVLLAFEGGHMESSATAGALDLWSRIRNTSWLEDNGWAGGDVEFFADAAGKPRYRHRTFGSGRPVVMDVTGPLVVGVLEIRFTLASDPPDAPGAADASGHGDAWDYVFDPETNVFLSPTSCDHRLRLAKAPVRNPYLDEAATWASIRSRLKPGQKPTVIREALYEAVRFHESAIHQVNLPEVAVLTEHHDPQVRRFAFWAARKGLVPDLSPALAGLGAGMRDSDASVRQAAEDTAFARRAEVLALASAKTSSAQIRQRANEVRVELDRSRLAKKLDAIIEAHWLAHPVHWRAGEPHPGIQLDTRHWDASLREVAVDTVPADHRFIDGVPVLEVRMLSTNDRGEVVPPEMATRIEISQRGPGGRELGHVTGISVPAHWERVEIPRVIEVAPNTGDESLLPVTTSSPRVLLLDRHSPHFAPAYDLLLEAARAHAGATLWLERIDSGTHRGGYRVMAVQPST